MKCKSCGNQLGVFKKKRKDGKIMNFKWFSEYPFVLYGVEYYRTECIECIKKRLGRDPKSPNVFNSDYKIILGIPNELFERKKKERFGFTKEKSIKKHGEEKGLRKWNEYREKQAYTNSFEYKNKKYGWSKEYFDEYNKKRSVTKDNLIKRHGKEKGLQKWNEYREKQAYTNSLKYFIRKYGEDEGFKKWKKVNKEKALTIENFIRKYGEDKGFKKWKDYIKNRNNSLYYSKVSQELFWMIWDKINNNGWKIYFKELNNEFFLRKDNNVIFLDFVVLKDNNYKDKKCIEFNGDYWHCNPKMYENSDIINYTGKGKIKVSEIWKRDEEKMEFIKDDNFDIMIVWENDFYNSKEDIVKKCIDFLER